MTTQRKTNLETTRAVLATVKSLQMWTLILYMLLGLTLYNTTVIKRDLAVLQSTSLILRMDSGTGPSRKGNTLPLGPATSEGGDYWTSVPKDRTFEDVCPDGWSGGWQQGFDLWQGCA